MKDYIHARLGKQERTVLEQLKKSTGLSESELVRRGLQLVAREVEQRSSLDLAGSSTGRFAHGPPDLATNPKHLDDFGR